MNWIWMAWALGIGRCARPLLAFGKREIVNWTRAASIQSMFVNLFRMSWSEFQNCIGKNVINQMAEWTREGPRKWNEFHGEKKYESANAENGDFGHRRTSKSRIRPWQWQWIRPANDFALLFGRAISLSTCKFTDDRRPSTVNVCVCARHKYFRQSRSDERPVNHWSPNFRYANRTTNATQNRAFAKILWSSETH